MAPRRRYRSVKVDINNVHINLVLNDVLCPICRSILIEPVTIPCNHGFCLSCFEGTVANANLTCPLCRVRFSSWHRLAKKDNKIVNTNLWEAIKNAFPQQVENKLNGVEENLEEEQQIILAAPGQIRKEYEEQKKKELLEIQKLHEAEAKASEELIKKIVEEEAKKRNNLQQDEYYARQLEKELNNVNMKPQVELKGTDVTKKLGPLDKFLHNTKSNNCKTNNISIKSFPKEFTESKVEINKKECEMRVLCQDNKLSKSVKSITCNDKITKNGTINSATKSISENKVNLFDGESRYFKPIDLKNIPPSKIVPILRVPAKLNKACTLIIGSPAGKSNFTHNRLLSAFARFEMTSPILGIQSKEQNVLPKRNQYRKRRPSHNVSNVENVDENSSSPKSGEQSQLGSDIVTSKRPCIRRSSRILSMDKTSDRVATIHHIERSPNTRSKQRIINKIVEESMSEENTSSKPVVNAESPPCHGFERVENKILDCDVKVCNNNVLSEEERLLQKEMQEASDLEFAKKLQEEFNKGRYTTRSSITHTDKFYKKHRQVKLDEIIKCRNKVK
ncbi:Zinc finger, C3HC4 type (RING finger) [Popillia japonica]|uniref:RING-type E3 ubiquitin transferase n=1 Tax=Popillia japonica TaxID=7064 RepID=A0AAW1IBX8_POPJA